MSQRRNAVFCGFKDNEAVRWTRDMVLTRWSFGKRGEFGECDLLDKRIFACVKAIVLINFVVIRVFWC